MTYLKTTCTILRTAPCSSTGNSATFVSVCWYPKLRLLPCTNSRQKSTRKVQRITLVGGNDTSETSLRAKLELGRIVPDIMFYMCDQVSQCVTTDTMFLKIASRKSEVPYSRKHPNICCSVFQLQWPTGAKLEFACFPAHTKL